MRVILLGVLLSLLGGCAILPELKPEDLQKQGLVAVDVRGTFLFHSALSIDGKYYDSLGYGDQLVVALPPGAHTLEALSDQGPTTSSSFVAGVTVKNTSYTTYLVKRNFTVEQGRMTSLGTLYILLDNPFQAKKYWTFWLEDSRRIDKMLQEHSPEVYKLLGTPKYTLAPGDYTTGKRLSQLRGTIAMRNLSLKRYRGGPASWPNQEGVVTGDLGTLAVFRNDSQGKAKIHLLDSDTIESRYGADAYGQRVVVLQEDKSLLYIRNGKSTVIALPKGFDNSDLFLYGKHGILLSNLEFSFARSDDDGRSWRIDNRFRLKDGDDGVYRSEADGGFYYFTKTGYTPLLYVDRAKGELRSVDIGKDKGEFFGVVDTEAGLYLGPTVGLFSASEIYFRPRNSNNWTVFKAPGACYDLGSLDPAGNSLVINCGSWFISHDGGKNWNKR